MHSKTIYKTIEEREKTNYVKSVFVKKKSMHHDNPAGIKFGHREIKNLKTLPRVHFSTFLQSSKVSVCHPVPETSGEG